MFGGIKDSLASSAAKSFIAGRLERYAKLTDLRIHSRERAISLELLLEGETLPIRIEGNYRVTAVDGANQLTFEGIAATRPWLNNLLEDLLVGKPLGIPALALLAFGGPQG
jgi:hypothetical protein